MATYYHGVPDLQAEGLQRLYLMNPGLVGYTDEQMPAGNLLFSHSSGHPSLPIGHGNHSQQLVGIPLQAISLPPHQPSPPPRDSTTTETASLLWGPAELGLFQTPTPELPTGRTSSLQQGLSLSLSSQYPSYSVCLPEIPPPAPVISEEVQMLEAKPGISNGIDGYQSAPLKSKYLKAAQELLEEVVNVGKGVIGDRTKRDKGYSILNKENTPEDFVGEVGLHRGADLTPAERQELQIKKSKLISMLEEVEQRYRQYHQQMQLVITSFEAVAGPGSARIYTELALRTISKQFRSLRDAISGQIKSVNKVLGEEDGRFVGSRLKLVDQQLRQQKALQQLGMMQHNAWRPQRGLPERSVSVLRAWLFEHFLHPYPKDSDKIMLAKQTGLTRSQVSNWFINARVRLWKPMVEEMYLEEMKEQTQNESIDKGSRSEVSGGSKSSQGQSRLENDPCNFSAGPSSSPATRFSSLDSPELHPPAPELETMMHGSAKRPRLELQSPTAIATMAAPSHDFASYHIGGDDLEQFASPFAANGVSLTLGLPHCEGLSLSGGHQSFLPGQNVPFCGLRVPWHS